MCVEVRAEEVSRLFPAPIRLKFEKVYQPCVLVTKKRYTGYCYSGEGEAPVWARRAGVRRSVEGKGIEMIRSDQCAYVKWVSEEVLRRVFGGCSETQLREWGMCRRVNGRFVQGEFRRLLANEVAVPELVLWREVRMGSYKETDGVNHLPPAAVVSVDAMAQDERCVCERGLRRSEMPLYREKVPYVVVVGGPNVGVAWGLNGRVGCATRWCLRACCWARVERATT